VPTSAAPIAAIREQTCVIYLTHDLTPACKVLSDALSGFGDLQIVDSVESIAESSEAACALLPLTSVMAARTAMWHLRQANFAGPILFYTAKASTNDRMDVLRAGAQDIIDVSLDNADTMRRAVLHALARSEFASSKPRSVETNAAQSKRATSATLQMSRLEWLLQGVLEMQQLVTDADFDLDAFMQRVVDLAEQLTGAKGAVIELLEGEEMVYRSASFSVREHLGLRLNRATSLSGLCVSEQRVLHCDDTEQDSRADRDACRRVGVRSMLCTPLVEAGRAVGVLKVLGAEPSAFDEDDQYLLSLLAGSLGAALGRQLVLRSLKSSEEIFRTAMETAPIGNALVTPEGRFITVNHALCELLGYSEDELLAGDFQSVTHPDDIALDLVLVQRCLSGEIDRYRLEKRYFHKSGRLVWALLSVALVRHNNGQPNYFVTQIQDTTEQREIERVKSEFISVVSHELRTPLTSIRGSVGLVLGAHAAVLPDSAKRFLEIASSNCERLMSLINDILDIEKIASGNMRFELQPLVLADMMRNAVQAAEGYAERLNVRVELDAPASDVKIVVDEQRLQQVLANLLSNAAKFSPAHGTVQVAVERAQDQVRICVRDHGPGIPEDFRDRIFGKFSQADSSSTRRAGGTGLGLHISRQIVEHMGGRIGFDTVVGSGTTFWVEFALAA
jgi:PAS domain S-box-containing protein